MNYTVKLAMNPSIDKTSSDEIVTAERKLYCKPTRFEPGGGGVNVSRSIKKLGGESILLCAAGDRTGRRFKDLLYQSGAAGTTPNDCMRRWRQKIREPDGRRRCMEAAKQR